jgi:predicted Rossmann fold nucleotide-binding protein DprA/Smf involved in DNA uptake
MTSNGQSPLQAQPLPRGAAEYPVQLLRVLGDHAPDPCFTLGQRKPLALPLLALFCSERCPGDLIINGCDAATALRDAGVTVISGFHSPVERECLRILLRGAQPVVICPARSIERMRVPADWRDPIREGRLLLVSPFAAKHDRITAALAAQRNEFVAALARAVLVVYADPAGQIETLAKKVMGWGRPLLTLESPQNADLVRVGAQPIQATDITADASWSREVSSQPSDQARTPSLPASGVRGDGTED